MDGPGGYPYHFFSGPAADYGPQGGPLHGLVDQGRPEIWDTPEHRPPGDEAGPGQGGGRRGGGRGGNYTFTPYAGMAGGGSFVDWQPIQPGTPGPYEPTRFVPGGGGDPLSAAQPPGGRGGRRGGGAGGRGGAGGQGQRQGGGGSGAGGGQRPAPAPAQPASSPASPLDIMAQIVFGGGTGGHNPGIGEASRAATHGGVDVGNLDFATPGWTRDPTTGILNTSGFPGSTIPAPRDGESFDEYLTRLHDAGFDQATIQSLLGGQGFSPGDHNVTTGRDDPWTWNWGTGPVVRDEGGYRFARSGESAGNAGGNTQGSGGVTGLNDLASAADFFHGMALI